MNNIRSSKFHLNRIHTAIELLLRRPTPTNVPIFCLHEPTTGCNLRCPACPTGAGIFNLRETARLNHYEEVCAEMGHYLEVYYLFNWGEAILVKDLPNIIKRLRQEKFYIHMSSNFSLEISDELLDVFASTPQLSLQIDIDGTDQTTHQRSRIKSDLNLVLKNARRLSDRIKVSASPPYNVFIGFLEFDYNKEQRLGVESIAKNLGFGFSVVNDALEAGEAPKRSGGFDLNQNFGCTWLYTSVLPSPMLKNFAPCCGVWDKAAMSERRPNLSIHETFMNDPKYQNRRITDAEFSSRSKADRIAALELNIEKETGMALRQAELSGDVCERCSMGGAYQAKLPRIINGAIESFSILSGASIDIASRKFDSVARQLLGSDEASLRYRAQMVNALNMPPVRTRNFESYGSLIKILVQ